MIAEKEYEITGWGRVRQTMLYVIATTNRTGSYLLCEGLGAAGVAGQPTEALTPDYRQELCQQIYGKKIEEIDFSVSIKTMIRQGMSWNGVFGVKVHWDQVEEVAYESTYEGPPYTVLLEEFPGARYIHLERRDTLAQAISLSIALQTDEWWRMKGDESPKGRELIFNREEILRLEQDLIRQRESWEWFFKSEGITPLRMDYEELAADYRGQVGRALSFLGQDPAIAETIPEPRIMKQGNARNELWKSWMR